MQLMNLIVILLMLITPLLNYGFLKFSQIRTKQKNMSYSLYYTVNMNLLCWFWRCIHIFSNTIFVFVHVFLFCTFVKIILSEIGAQSPEVEVVCIWTRGVQDAWYLDDLYLTFSLCSTPPLWHTTEWWWWQKLSGTCAGRKWTSHAGAMPETAWQTQQLPGTKASTWSAH